MKTVIHANFTPVRNGKTSAICELCDCHSRPVKADDDGEPALWELPRGWSEAPYPHDYQHRDGSFGANFTCPKCNARLKQGQTLTVSAWRIEAYQRRAAT